MGFKKSGDVKIAKVFCKCGAELCSPAAKCPNCGKQILPEKKDKEKK